MNKGNIEADLRAEYWEDQEVAIREAKERHQQDIEDGLYDDLEWNFEPADWDFYDQREWYEIYKMIHAPLLERHSVAAYYEQIWLKDWP